MSKIIGGILPVLMCLTVLLATACDFRTVDNLCGLTTNKGGNAMNSLGSGGDYGLQPVSEYQEDMGVPASFINQHRKPAGYLNNIGRSIGFLISRDLFITDAFLPSANLRDLYVTFGDYRLGDSKWYGIKEMVEMRDTGGLMYTIFRLNGSPGDEYGWHQVTVTEPAVGERVVITPHPNAGGVQYTDVGSYAGGGSINIEAANCYHTAVLDYPDGKAIGLTNGYNAGQKTATLYFFRDLIQISPTLRSLVQTVNLTDQEKPRFHSTLRTEDSVPHPEIGMEYAPQLQKATRGGNVSFSFMERGYRVTTSSKKGGDYALATIVPFTTGKPDLSRGTAVFWADVISRWRKKGSDHTYNRAFVQFNLAGNAYVQLYAPDDGPALLTLYVNGAAAAPSYGVPKGSTSQIVLQWDFISGFGSGNNLRLYCEGNLLVTGKANISPSEVNAYTQLFQAETYCANGGPYRADGAEAVIDNITVWDIVVDPYKIMESR